MIHVSPYADDRFLDVSSPDRSRQQIDRQLRRVEGMLLRIICEFPEDSFTLEEAHDGLDLHVNVGEPDIFSNEDYVAIPQRRNVTKHLIDTLLGAEYIVEDGIQSPKAYCINNDHPTVQQIKRDGYVLEKSDDALHLGYGYQIFDDNEIEEEG